MAIPASATFLNTLLNLLASPSASVDDNIHQNTPPTAITLVGILYIPTTPATTSPSQPILKDGFFCNTMPNHIAAKTNSHCNAYPRALTENSMNVGKAATQPAVKMPASCP